MGRLGKQHSGMAFVVLVTEGGAATPTWCGGVAQRRFGGRPGRRSFDCAGAPVLGGAS